MKVGRIYEGWRLEGYIKGWRMEECMKVEKYNLLKRFCALTVLYPHPPSPSPLLFSSWTFILQSLSKHKQLKTCKQKKVKLKEIVDKILKVKCPTFDALHLFLRQYLRNIFISYRVPHPQRMRLKRRPETLQIWRSLGWIKSSNIVF